MFETLLSGLQSSGEGIATMLVQGTEALAIAFVTILFAGFVKRLLPRIADRVDAMVMGGKIDLPEYVHEAIERTIVYGIYLVGLYLMLFVSQVTNPIDNQFFQLFVLAVSGKIVLDVTPSAIEEVDRMSPMKISGHTKALLRGLIRYVVYTALIVGTLTILGYTKVFTAALAGAGVMGVAVGFATKDVLSNAIAGLMIIFDRPFRIGESIKIKDMVGTVRGISLRKTTIQTYDGKVIMVPNSILATDPIYNFSMNKIRRFDVTVGVDYKTDLKKATEIIKKAVPKVKGVLVDDAHPTIVALDKFNESSINMKVLFWVDLKHGYWGPVSGVPDAINTAFKKAKIKIPFPQRVVHKA